MTEPAPQNAALSSARDAVQEVRETLEQLYSRLDSEEGTGAYLAALEEATGLTNQMTELLESAVSRSS